MVILDDGSQTLKIDEDMKGLTLSPNDLRDYLAKKYTGQSVITKIDGKTIKFWRRSAREYSRSKKTQLSNGFGKTALADHLLELVENSEPGKVEPRFHNSENGIILGKHGYEKRTAQIIDNNDDVYDMEIIIGLNNTLESIYYGNNFYDVIDININKNKRW